MWYLVLGFLVFLVIYTYLVRQNKPIRRRVRKLPKSARLVVVFPVTIYVFLVSAIFNLAMAVQSIWTKIRKRFHELVPDFIKALPQRTRYLIYAIWFGLLWIGIAYTYAGIVSVFSAK